MTGRTFRLALACGFLLAVFALPGFRAARAADHPQQPAMVTKVAAGGQPAFKVIVGATASVRVRIGTAEDAGRDERRAVLDADDLEITDVRERAGHHSSLVAAAGTVLASAGAAHLYWSESNAGVQRVDELGQDQKTIDTAAGLIALHGRAATGTSTCGNRQGSDSRSQKRCTGCHWPLPTPPTTANTGCAFRCCAS